MNQPPRSPLKFFFCLFLVAVAFFSTYVFFHETRIQNAAKKNTVYYGDLFSHYLWDLDEQTAQEYASLIAQGGEFKSIHITHPDGANFAQFSAISQSNEIRDSLRSLGLIWDIQNKSTIHYHGQQIGFITTITEHDEIYLYFYQSLIITLAIVSLTLIRLSRANKNHQHFLQHDLSEKNERLHSVVSTSPVIAFSLDKKGTFTVCEGMGLNKLHGKPQDIIGKTIEEVHHHMPTCLADFLRALKGESFSEIRSTEDRSYETWYSPIRDADSIVGVTGVSTDVTAAIHAMDSLNNYKKNQAKNHDLARKSHLALLPESPPTLMGFDIGFLTKPADSIGGDYIQFSPCAEKNSLGVTFSEMSGHGISSALLASIFDSQVQQHLRSQPPSISDAFYIINNAIHNTFPEGRFASTFHTILDGKNSTMRFVKASREPAVLYRHNSTIEVFDKGGPALGLLPSDLLNSKSFIEHSVDLNPGDTLFLYSDGLISVENSIGKMLERKNIIDWVKEDIHLGPQQIAESLFRRIISFSNGEDIVDDISIFILRKT